jgi:hypothetical protein
MNVVDVLPTQEWIQDFKIYWNHHKKGDLGWKEKNRGDEPIQIIIHINMEMLQWNILYS